MRLKGRHWLMLWLVRLRLRAARDRRPAELRFPRRPPAGRAPGGADGPGGAPRRAGAADPRRLEPPGPGSARRADARPPRALGFRVHSASRHALALGQALMAKPTARIAAIQFGFAIGVVALLARAVQLQIIDGEQVGARGGEQAHRAASARGPAGRAVRPQRGPARHHPGVLPRRDRPQRAGRPRRGVPADRPQSRHSGGAPRSRVPREEALDLPPRPVQRDAGPAAALDQWRAPRGRLPAVLPIARARPSHHRRARGRSRRRRSRPRAGAGLDSHRYAGRGGAVEGSGGAALRFARAPGARPGARQRRRAHHRRRASGDRRARTRRRAGGNGGGGRRRRLPGSEDR